MTTKEEARSALRRAIDQFLIEIGEVKSEQLDDYTISGFLQKINDLQFQVQQYKIEHGQNDWMTWGPNHWNKIDSMRLILMDKLQRIRVDLLQSERHQLEEVRQKLEEKRDKEGSSNAFVMIVMLFCALAAGVSAVYSVFFYKADCPCLTSSLSTTEMHRE